MINKRPYVLIKDYRIEFFVGCLYETKDRRRVVCVFDNLPGLRPILMIELETPEGREAWIKLYSPELRGQYYEMIQSNDDIVEMIPNSPLIELMAENKVHNEKVEELKNQMRLVENFGKEKNKEWNNNWYDVYKHLLMFWRK